MYIKFHENSSSESRFFHADGQIPNDMTKLIIAFYSFTNAPKNYSVTLCVCVCVCVYACKYVSIFILISRFADQR